MDSVYLLDTNILSEPLKKSPDPDVLEFLEKNETIIATCGLVIHELKFGMEILEESKKKKLIETFIKSILETLPIYEYNTAASIWHAKEKARLTKSGNTPTFTDGQIASIAHINNLKLVTKNAKDFKPFKIEVVSF